MQRREMARRELLTLGLASMSAALLRPHAARGQARYPERAIKLVVPFAPGGVVDVIGRLWAERMKPLIGTIVVENIGGAGGTIGATDVARAPPDGYTLLLGNTSTQVISPITAKRVAYNPEKDFTAVSIIAISATCIVVNAAVPAKTFGEFIAYAKKPDTKLSYGSAGAGTLTNLTGEMFKQLIGAPNIVHVPYKGAAPGIADLVSGHIPMMTPNVTGQLLELHRSGKVRILAVASPTRLKGAPEIPTAIESGLPNMVAQLFNGVFAPAQTPMTIVDQIAAATHTALADAEFQKTLIKSGFEPVLDSDPQKAQALVGAEHARLVPVIKAAGMAGN